MVVDGDAAKMKCVFFFSPSSSLGALVASEILSTLRFQKTQTI